MHPKKTTSYLWGGLDTFFPGRNHYIGYCACVPVTNEMLRHGKSMDFLNSIRFPADCRFNYNTFTPFISHSHKTIPITSNDGNPVQNFPESLGHLSWKLPNQNNIFCQKHPGGFPGGANIESPRHSTATRNPPGSPWKCKSSQGSRGHPPCNRNLPLIGTMATIRNRICKVFILAKGGRNYIPFSQLVWLEDADVESCGKASFVIC